MRGPPSSPRRDGYPAPVDARRGVETKVEVLQPQNFAISGTLAYAMAYAMAYATLIT